MGRVFCLPGPSPNSHPAIGDLGKDPREHSGNVGVPSPGFPYVLDLNQVLTKQPRNQLGRRARIIRLLGKV